MSMGLSVGNLRTEGVGTIECGESGYCKVCNVVRRKSVGCCMEVQGL